MCDHVAPAQRPPVSLDELCGIQLGVDHDGVHRGVTQEGLDHIGRRVVVEVLGSERPAAVVGPEPKGAAIGLAGAGGFGQITDVGADCLDPDGGGVLHGLQEIGGSRARAVLVGVPVVTRRDGGSAVEALDAFEDLGEHPAQPVANGDHPGPVALRWLDVHEVVAPPVCLPALSGISRSRSTTTDVIRAAVRRRACSKPTPTRS